ncbi:MAG: hypothetical protein SFY66_00655 [Oculatellaceae cyanobacterium bins.114]|nr:hypothetical protein [Oculatellaceae cyanobacterium bins.114]
MAGLFGFFGKKKGVEEKTPATNEGQSQAFFLDSDDAKTFGNIDYMRTVKTIKRTFPKTAGNKSEFESVVQVSAMGMTRGELEAAIEAAEEITKAAEMNGANANGTNINGAAPKADTGASERRRSNSDGSMDMFRNMAREIRKR